MKVTEEDAAGNTENKWFRYGEAAMVQQGCDGP
jgi:hypothetical protein